MLIRSLSFLALIHVAMSTPPAAPLEVTALDIFEPSGRSAGDKYTVNFDVADTGDQWNTQCSVEWSYGNPPPGGYIPCDNSDFEFRFVNYVRYFDFVLDVKHKTPQGTTVFADGAVQQNGNIFCKSASSGFTRCTQIGGPFVLEVYDVQS